MALGPNQLVDVWQIPIDTHRLKKLSVKLPSFEIKARNFDIGSYMSVNEIERRGGPFLNSKQPKGNEPKWNVDHRDEFIFVGKDFFISFYCFILQREMQTLNKYK